MSRGGARNRGPNTPQPGSENDLRRRRGFLVLPKEGYDGEVPNFPLPRPGPREIALWRWAWRTPQAAAWAREPWRWQAVALWVRFTARVERPKANAALVAQVTRLGDQIGMTPAGLRENEWQVEAEPTRAGDVLTLHPGGGDRPTSAQRVRSRFPTRPADPGEGA